MFLCTKFCSNFGSPFLIMSMPNYLWKPIHAPTHTHCQHYNCPSQIQFRWIILAPAYQLFPSESPDISFCYVLWGKNKAIKQLLSMHLTALFLWSSGKQKKFQFNFFNISSESYPKQKPFSEWWCCKNVSKTFVLV